MKILLFPLFILSQTLFAQKVILRGVATDTFSRSNYINLVVNDTFNKFLASDRAEFESGNEILENKDLMTKTGKNGYFEIKVNPSDTLFFSAFEHITEAHLVADLLKRDSIRIDLKPKVCIEYKECHEPGKIFVFIGEKLDVKKAEEIFYCNYITLDLEYKAKYKIIETLYGKHNSDTINFTAYDHWGTPNFSTYEKVILYVAEYCGEFVHFKYEFDPLYKTKNGKWASPYRPRNYRNVDSGFHIQPRKIEFLDSLVYDIQEGHEKGIRENFKEPYSKIENGKLRIYYGNYPEELLELKKVNNKYIGKFFEE